MKPKTRRGVRDRSLKARTIEASKVDAASSHILNQLTSVVKGFPSLDSLDLFYREIADVIIGVDKLKEALGALDGNRAVIQNLAREHIRKIRSARSIMEIRNLRRAAYGRMSSIIEKAGIRLEVLAIARDKLRKVVSIDADEPTVVVAGAPNVGKSSLVRIISSAKPEIADYPFTTRSLIIGHLTHGKERIQVIDTPGLLDRPLRERNPLELQAVVALRYLAKMIIFIFDPSEICGYTMMTQVNVFNEIKDLFKETPFLVVVNKIDILTDEQLKSVQEVPGGNILVKISAVTGEGIGNLIDTLFKTILFIGRSRLQTHSSEGGDSPK